MKMKPRHCAMALLGLLITAGAGKVPAVDLPDSCAGVRLAFQTLPQPPKDIGVPLPEGATFFGGNPGSTISVNGEAYTMLPMARFLVKQSPEEVARYYQKQLGDEWKQEDLFGMPVFVRRSDLARAGSVRDLLLARPGAHPSIMLSDVADEECAQAVLKGARTMIEIVSEK